jgi:hypothetical protein
LIAAPPFRVAESRSVRRASPETAADFATLAFLGRDEGENQQKQRHSFRVSEMNGFATRAQVLEIIGGAKWAISRNRLFSMP